MTTDTPHPVRWVRGHFHAHEITRYVVALAVLFWSQIALCWWIYPAENQFSILTHTFSFLGRWEDYHNPAGWWLFSTAMVLWGVLQIPLVLYAHRRLRRITPWGTGVSTALLLIGSVSISLVGIFPDVRGEVIGSLEYRQLHTWAAIAVFVGYALGIGGYGLVILSDRIRNGADVSAAGLTHGRFTLPFAFWISVVMVAGYFQGRWGIMYARMRAEAEAAGVSIGSSWAESSGTIWAFQLWENIVIYALFIFWVWFMLALPREAPVKALSPTPLSQP